MAFGNRSCDIIEIIERDASMRKTGSWKFNADDKNLANSILGYIIRKYNFRPKEAKQEQQDNSLKVDW